MTTPLDWLRNRSDESLVALLRARPDLAMPAPDSLSVLSRRLDSPPSVWRVMEGLDRFALQLLQAAAVLTQDGVPVTGAALAELLGPDVSVAAVTRTLGPLEDLGLFRRLHKDGGAARAVLSPAVGSALGEFPGGLGPSAGLGPQEVAAALAGLAPAERGLLDRLAQGQPRGLIGRSGQVAELAAGLIEAGLLIEGGPGAVLLPREVTVALRGGAPLGQVFCQPPPDPPAEPGPETVDATAAAQALAAVALVGSLLAELGENPAAALKSGGLGVRELRRLARSLDVEEPVLALLVEILAAAGLLAPDQPRGRISSGAWTPTTLADDFLAEDPETAWATLAGTWLALRREPSRIGRRDSADKVINALSPEVAWVRGPADRRFVLGLLADLAPGTRLAGDDRRARLAWFAPLRPADRRRQLADSVLAEATTLGLVAFDALSEAGRSILRGDGGTAATALAAALPEPVDRVLVQADLTVIAPGRLDQALADRLARAAEVESAGSATVYRVSAQSLRRALDGGATAADLHELFDRHSATPVPQALTYLIDDVARRHGVLRAGPAGCYLRSDDPAQLDAALAAAADLRIRRLAPTVAVAQASLETVLPVLRAAGLAPAAEDERGLVVALTATPQRTRPVPLLSGPHREPPPADSDQLLALVERMRAVDRSVAVAGQSPAEVVGLLRQAARERHPVWIAYVDSEGGTSRRLIDPIAVSGGSVAAYDRLRRATRTFALHRVGEVTAAQPSPDGAAAESRNDNDLPSSG